MTDPVLLYGTTEPPAPARRLTAGRLEADLVDGNLRSIRYAGREIIRAVAYVVRDRDWGTFDLGVTNPAITQTPDSFSLSWQAVCTGAGGARLHLAATIRGEAAGRLLFEVDAVPDGDFETNRCGFCILHPILGLAGAPATITHSDGTVENAVFPDLIEPWQPFKDIAAIRHEAAPGLAVTCRMAGDVFEMEDQRAWSDASYKTYVRPLDLPWPYFLAAGETNRQRVTVEIDASGAVLAPAAVDPVIALSLGTATDARFPQFGVLVSPEDVALVLAAPDRLADLAPRHILFHFDPAAGHGRRELEAMAAVRALHRRADAILECIVACAGDLDAELSGTARLVAAAQLDIQAVTVCPSVDRQSTPPGSQWPACPPLDAVYAAARRAFPGLPLGGGMVSYFTELNRKRPPVEHLDYVTHATCPIVHAADDLSVMQTLEALPFITRSTRAIIGAEKPYHLGPTTIGMRQNPYGSRTMPNPDGRRIAMAFDDPRQRGRFAAAWLVGYAARLADAGIERWTGGSLAGARGFVGPDGGQTPSFAVAKGLAAASGLRLRPLVSPLRERVDGFTHETGDGALRLWIANLTSAPQRVRLPPGHWRGAPSDETDLAPYAVATFESPVSPAV